MSDFAQAQALHRAGRLDEARAAYADVLQAEPRHGGALHMLGLLAFQAGQNDVAVEQLRQALALEPQVPALHANLGNVLMELGRLDEAMACFSAALARNPKLAQAHAGLGDALAHLGRVAQARASYEQAVACDPDLSEALASLAVIALTEGDGGTAIARIRAALAVKETARYRRVFCEIARWARWSGDDPAMRVLLARAVTEGWDRAGRLGGAVADLVKHRLMAGGTLESDALLLAYLPAAPNSDIEMERILTRVRRQLLARALRGENADLPFSAALAQQCFINEYVFALTPDEERQALALKALLEAGGETPPLVIAAVAAYFPLHNVAGAERLLRQRLPDPIMALLRQQLAEPLEEARIAAALPQRTPIGGAVSEKVRGQYEENPYPRWVTAAAPDDAITLNAFLSQKFSTTYRPTPALPRMLSAGCGTGQYAMELAQRFRPASVLAVDLSRASLAYAARKAAERKLEITFAQADILRLDGLEERFDFIESSGVLHHMEDPFAGWRALARCLAPGGAMRVALYSRTARTLVAKARDWILQQGFPATPDGIRACRALLMQKPEGELGMIAGAADFFSVSACRDLLFHVEEHGMDLAGIAAFLKENGLTFLGFEIGEKVLALYRARFPGDPTAIDLGNWAVFEAERPGTFAAMYQFWVQGASAPPPYPSTSSG